jgi:hypothetical protein
LKKIQNILFFEELEHFLKESTLYARDDALLFKELELFFLDKSTLYFEKVLFFSENLSLVPWKVHCSSKKLFVLEKNAWVTCLD